MTDIIIMVIINGSPDDLKQFRKSLVDIASDLSLEYDITVSLLLFDSDTFSKYKNAMPFFGECAEGRCESCLIKV